MVGTATQIPGDGGLHFLFSGVRLLIEEGFGCHNHPGRAETTLDGTLGPKFFLEWMEFPNL